MQARKRWMWVAICLAGAWTMRGLTQDVPLPTWRPIPELPPLLWFSEFSDSADEAKRLYKNGTIVAQDPAKPEDTPVIKAGRPAWQNDPYMALGKRRWDKGAEQKVDFSIDLAATKLRAPDTLNPNQILLLFNVWANEPGKFVVTVKAGGEFSDTLTLPRVNQWCPLKVSWGSLMNKGVRIKPESLAQEIRFIFTPTRPGENLPHVFIDKVILSYQQPPERMAQLLMAWQMKMGQLAKSVATDGFCYNDKIHTSMQKLLSRTPRSGQVLVFLPPLNGSDDLSAQWNAAAREASLHNVAFIAARDPRKLFFASLDVVRAFLPSLLHESEYQATMLVVTREEGSRTGKEVDGLRTILERLLAAHCIPMLCLPAENTGDGKLGEFLQSTVKLCDDLGVAYADQGFAFKAVPNPYADGKLTAEGEKALCGLLVASYKHIQESLNPRR